MIHLKNISKSYGDHKVISNYSLEIKDGEFIIISGVSGSGKTTLLNIIGLLENNFEGSIFINGIENPQIFHKDGRKLLANDIGYLMQNYGLAEEETIYDNLIICMHQLKLSKKEKKEIMLDALKYVKLDYDLQTRVHSLSGGEMQRVAIAKIIVKNAKIILCDEPTGSLDERNCDIVMNYLKEINEKQKKTIILVTHDKNLFSYASRIINI